MVTSLSAHWEVSAPTQWLSILLKPVQAETAMYTEMLFRRSFQLAHYSTMAGVMPVLRRAASTGLREF